MALGIVPNGIKIEFNAQQNGIPVVNRMYCTTTGAVTLSDLNDVATAAYAFWLDLAVNLHTSYILSDITVTDVSIANGTQVITPYSTANTGSATGAEAAANAAVVLSLRTARTGRSFRGRTYIGGLPVSAFTTAQTVSTGFAGLLAVAMVDFITALNGIGKTLVVVSNYANKVVRVIALATEIVSIIADNKVDSQRRRTAN